RQRLYGRGNQQSVFPPQACTIASTGELGTLWSLQHMPIQTSCPTCATAYNLPDGQRGKRVRCRHCADTFVVGGARAAGDDDIPLREGGHDQALRRFGWVPRPGGAWAPARGGQENEDVPVLEEATEQDLKRFQVVPSPGRPKPVSQRRDWEEDEPPPRRG